MRNRTNSESARRRLSHKATDEQNLLRALRRRAAAIGITIEHSGKDYLLIGEDGIKLNGGAPLTLASVGAAIEDCVRIALDAPRLGLLNYDLKKVTEKYHELADHPEVARVFDLIADLNL